MEEVTREINRMLILLQPNITVVRKYLVFETKFHPKADNKISKIPCLSQALFFAPRNKHIIEKDHSKIISSFATRNQNTSFPKNFFIKNIYVVGLLAIGNRFLLV